MATNEELENVVAQCDPGSSNVEILYAETVEPSEILDNKQPNHNQGLNWGPEETKLLFTLFKKYLPEVGLTQTFRSKKQMWEQIGLDIERTLGIKKTGIQCENRYKTIMKRRSGRSKMFFKKVQIESPFRARSKKFQKLIANKSKFNKGKIVQDYINFDSDEEESDSENLFYLCSVNDVARGSLDAKKTETLQDTMLYIYQMTEDNRERRHQEKMELMQELIEVLKNQ